MKLQKIILCVVVALTAFGLAVGLLDLGRYLRTAFQSPAKVEIKAEKTIPAPLPMANADIKFAPETYKPPVENEPETDYDYGETGDYYIAGRYKPKGFKDFDNLSILTHEYDTKLKKVVRVKPSGSIQAGKEFKFSWINIENKRISLITESVKGVSYQFDGKVIEEEELKYKDAKGEEITDYVYIKGRLTKWRNGVQIAEAKVKFAIVHGC